MRILRIITRFFPDIGGPAKQAYILSQYCSKQALKTIVIACKLKEKPYLKKKKINENLEIYYLPFSAPELNSGFFKLTIFFIRFFVYGFIKALKLNRNYKIDIIHAHSPPPAGFIAFLVSKMFKIPYFYSIHGLDYPSAFIFYLDINWIARNSKETFVVSKSIEKYIKTKFMLKNVNWFPNFIDTSNYFHVKSENEKYNLIKKLNLESFLAKGDLIITYIGYMIFEQKVQGMIDFLNAFSKFLTKFQNNGEKRKIKLIFIGEGGYSLLLKGSIKSLNLHDNALFLGRRNDIRDILAISDLLALTSYVEGFPNVVLEAMASKIPCLGTDVGEIKYIIGDTGFVVIPGDIVNMEKKIEIFYNLTQVDRLKLMENARIRVKSQFDINIVGKRLIEIYFQ